MINDTKESGVVCSLIGAAHMNRVFSLNYKPGLIRTLYINCICPLGEFSSTPNTCANQIPTAFLPLEMAWERKILVLFIWNLVSIWSLAYVKSRTVMNSQKVHHVIRFSSVRWALGYTSFYNEPILLLSYREHLKKDFYCQVLLFWFIKKVFVNRLPSFSPS